MPTCEKSQQRESSRWGVLILNWEDSKGTMACIESVELSAHNCRDVEFYGTVVDNGSSKDSLENLELFLRQRPRWTTLRLERNVGFSRGMNAGIDALADQGLTYVLLLNSDVLLQRETLAALVNDQKTNASELLGLSVIESKSSQRTAVAGYRYYSWLGAASAVPVDPGSPTVSSKLDYICGSAMLCSVDFLNRIGGIPEVSFLYFEELRLVRSMTTGGTPRCCAAAMVIHAEGTSAKKLEAPSRHYYAAHACFRFTGENGVFRLPTVVLARMLRLAYLSLTEADRKPLWDGFLALWDFLRGIERRPH